MNEELPLGPRPMGPLAAAHPLVTGGRLCSGCFVPFVVGDVVTLVPEHEWYGLAAPAELTVAAVVVHWRCLKVAPTSAH